MPYQFPMGLFLLFLFVGPFGVNGDCYVRCRTDADCEKCCPEQKSCYYPMYKGSEVHTGPFCEDDYNKTSPPCDMSCGFCIKMD